MASILVAGLINLETTARIDSFPIPYLAVQYPFFGVNTAVSGVGYNVALALSTLGNDVRLLAIIGQDQAGALARTQLAKDGMVSQYVCAEARQTAQSLILYDAQGRRMILTDLKDMQDQTYPEAMFQEALKWSELAVVCNVNYARPLLAMAKAAGVPVVTDVHAIDSLDDAYNEDFMSAADILFMSHEHLPVPAADWAEAVMSRYGPDILVIGLGESGALLALADGTRHHEPTYAPGPVVNTVGAGDALLSAFVHAYVVQGDPRQALQQAVAFAGHKIGFTGGANGFLTDPELRAFAAKRCLSPD